ncbi:MAG: M28 family peptidase, partial [Verrucomicrobiota bacterium]
LTPLAAMMAALAIFACRESADDVEANAEPEPPAEPSSPTEPEPEPTDDGDGESEGGDSAAADSENESSAQDGPEELPEYNPEEEEAILLTDIRQLTFAGKRAGEGYFNSDGTKMIFQSEREEDNPFYQIYLLDMETGDIERVSPGHGKTTCAWIHPSGEKVMFASTQDDPNALAEQEEEFELREKGEQRRYSWDYDEYFEVYEYDLNAKTYTKLTDVQGYDAEGAYSPDGTKIVYASNRLAYTDPESMSEEDRDWFKMDKKFMMDIYVADADGSNVKQLTTETGYDGGPFFSHDGTKICWRRFNRKGTLAEIHTMNSDGSNKMQLTTLGAMSWAPYFHPSGEYLIFATNLQGFANFELYLVDAAGEKEPVRVTWTDGFDGLPVFTPDGEKLSWTTNRTAEKKSQIFIADWNHEKAMELVGKAAPRSEPVSPGAMTRARPEPSPVPGIRDSTPEITVEDMRAHIEYLASEELKGRMTGTEGEELATSYVAKAFEKWGLSPYDENESSLSYFDEFNFTAGVDLGDENTLTLKIGDETRQLQVDKDWRPLSFSQLGEIDANEIVFAGYGIELPSNKNADPADIGSMPYTSFYHTDCSDKWVMMLRFIPEDLEGEERRKFLRFASARFKAITARQKGAKGVIMVTGPNSDVESELIRLAFDASMADSGIAAISLSTDVAVDLLKHAGEDLAEIQTALDKGEMMVGVQIPETTIDVKIDIDQQKAKGRNVIGRLKADDPEAQKRPAVLLGAHIDHLGNQPNSGSRATGKERSQIHYGADDNASGVAAVMEIAHYLADQKKGGKLKLERDVVFALWSGEELGLLGSAEYAREVAKNLKGDPDAQLTDFAWLSNQRRSCASVCQKALLNADASRHEVRTDMCRPIDNGLS